ncbi:MAG TPA: hypothetical protein VHC69_26135 [Polyangiaceae bacterium]|nr:hypothetical protein [Polyangiaceae bacterium]
MSNPAWLVRVASEDDRALLAPFECANPRVAWQVEVESFIRTRLLDWAFESGAADDEPRVLLVLHRRTGALIGVAAHERLLLREAKAGGSSNFYGTRLQVVAVAKKWQGKKLGKVRVSDVVMSAATTDIASRVPPRPRILAVVHKDNVQSLALCGRYGFVVELSSRHPSYRHLMTADDGVVE